MGMTMAEKILASRSGKSLVRPGEYVWANVDGTGVFSPVPLMDKLGARSSKRTTSRTSFSTAA